MKQRLGMAACAAALAAAMGCATGGRDAGRALPEYPTPEIAALERSLAGMPVREAPPKLLLERGHAYLIAAEEWVEGHPDSAQRRRDHERVGGWFARAIGDFETVVREHPDAPEAPEAMFHLGIVHDYPNLANLPVALSYYRRTVERYPRSEWAAEARKAIAGIEGLMRQMGAGQGI